MDSPTVAQAPLDDALFIDAALRPGRFRRSELRALVEEAGGLARLRSAILGGEPPGELSFGARAVLEEACGDRSGEAALSRLFERDDIRSIVLGDASYPALLAESSDPPLILFVRSETEVDLSRLPVPIALVGSRHATPYGREAAKVFAEGLAKSGVTVVSGLARGIDAAAHRASVTGGGPTVAVLGCGIDIDYPKENSRLAEDIAASGGAVISEYFPGSPPHAGHFPERNRIIAGMSHGVVVIEAADRSGSLITARLALEEGREVWGVPGSMFSETSSGSHRLIREGARLVASPSDVLSDLPMELVWSLAARRSEVSPEPDGSPAGPIWLLDLLSIEDAQGTDEIAAKSGRPIPEILSALLEGELIGAIRMLPGGRYVRTSKGLSVKG